MESRMTSSTKHLKSESCQWSSRRKTKMTQRGNLRIKSQWTDSFREWSMKRTNTTPNPRTVYWRNRVQICSKGGSHALYNCRTECSSTQKKARCKVRWNSISMSAMPGRIRAKSIASSSLCVELIECLSLRRQKQTASAGLMPSTVTSLLPEVTKCKFQLLSRSNFGGLTRSLSSNFWKQQILMTSCCFARATSVARLSSQSQLKQQLVWKNMTMLPWSSNSAPSLTKSSSSSVPERQESWSRAFHRWSQLYKACSKRSYWDISSGHALTVPCRLWNSLSRRRKTAHMRPRLPKSCASSRQALAGARHQKAALNFSTGQHPLRRMTRPHYSRTIIGLSSKAVLSSAVSSL